MFWATQNEEIARDFGNALGIPNFRNKMSADILAKATALSVLVSWKATL